MVHRTGSKTKVIVVIYQSMKLGIVVAHHLLSRRRQPSSYYYYHHDNENDSRNWSQGCGSICTISRLDDINGLIDCVFDRYRKHRVTTGPSKWSGKMGHCRVLLELCLCSDRYLCLSICERRLSWNHLGSIVGMCIYICVCCVLSARWMNLSNITSLDHILILNAIYTETHTSNFLRLHFC